MPETSTSWAERSSTGAGREEFYKVAFPQLRKIASYLLRRERPEHTLQPTALVGEVYLKLHRFQARIVGEEHFFRIAARAMRQVLIDHARARGSAKKVPLDAIPELLAARAPGTERESLLAVRGVFDQLREIDPRAATTVWMRCVEGRTIDEVSREQQRESWRVRADYDFGIQWMAKKLAAR